MKNTGNMKKIIKSCENIVLPGSDGVMPIAGYFGPHGVFVTDKYTTPDYLEDKYYQLAVDAGFNCFCYTEHDYATEPEEYHRALALAEKYNIGMFVIDSRIQPGMTDEEVSDYMAEYSKYKSFAGMYVADEPSTVYFPNKLQGFDQSLSRRLISGCAERSRFFNSYDNMLGYVNLLPIYHWMKSTPRDYENYVIEYCETCGGKFLSYDHYPFCVYYEGKSPEMAMRYYFLNFSIIYKYAKQYKLDIWSFVQAGGNWASHYKEVENYEPNREETLWLANVSLAYGSKAIQYYPFIQTYGSSLRPDGTIDPMRSGIVSADGDPTRYWHFAKDANAQIAVVGGILLKCECEGLIATGEVKTYTQGLQEFFAEGNYRQLKSVKTEASGTVIGCFDYEGKTAFYVVNNDREQKQNITLELEDVCTYRLLAAGCDEERTDKMCSLTLEPGPAVLMVIMS